MGSTNEVDTSQEELIEDDDFFLWEPTQEGAKYSNEVPKILCTVMDAGSALSLSRSKVYQLINSGELKTVHIGRSIRIRVSELETFIQNKTSID